MNRVAVFGGTFDPVHRGHLVPTIAAADTFRFDAVVFVPSARPPHKLGEPLTPFAHRFAMLALATQADDRCLVSDVEVGLDGPSYTVDTLRALESRLDSRYNYFLMGSDSFSQIATWHRWEELIEMTSLVVLHRDAAWLDEFDAMVPARVLRRVRIVEPFSKVPDPAPGEPPIYLFANQPFPVSASNLRGRLRQSLPVRDLVMPEVHRYMVKHRLYHQGASDTYGS